MSVDRTQQTILWMSFMEAPYRRIKRAAHFEMGNQPKSMGIVVSPIQKECHRLRGTLPIEIYTQPWT